MGAGVTAGPAILFLAQAGVGTLFLDDGGDVSNADAGAWLYTQRDLGQQRLFAAMEAVRAASGLVEVRPFASDTIVSATLVCSDDETVARVALPAPVPPRGEVTVELFFGTGNPGKLRDGAGEYPGMPALERFLAAGFEGEGRHASILLQKNLQAYNEFMKSSLRLNFRLLPLVTFILLVAQLVDPSPIWKGMLVVLGGAWLIGYVWARSIRMGLHLERQMRFGWAQVGDNLEEQFSLSNSGRLPATWVEILDHSDLAGYQPSLATCINPSETISWRTRGVCQRRGIYTLGGISLRSGDPLGIYTVEIHRPETATLAVMPPVVPLPDIEVAPGGWLGEGRSNPHAAEKIISAGAVRQYAPGDSLRLVHWPTTARLRESYVRELEGTPSGAWWIVLDFDHRVQAGRDQDSTTEAGVIMAASLADRGLRARKEVGFLASGEETVWMPPQGGELRRLEILRTLAALNPGEIPLAELLERAGPSLGRQASLIVITPSTESEWLKPLTHLAWRGIAPTVILLDAASFGAEQKVEPLATLLAEMRIPRQIVTRDLLDRPGARPPGRGQWEWRMLPTGKAIPIRTPGDMSWKRL